MERESILKIGNRRLKLVTYFPPSPADPVVRLVFPADIREADRTLEFQLYVPGSGAPYRTVRFNLRTMLYRGSLSY
jgi:hypothetical protein